MQCQYTKDLQKSPETCSHGFIDELVDALRGEEGCDEATIRANWKAVCADAPLVDQLQRASLPTDTPDIPQQQGADAPRKDVNPIVEILLTMFDFKLSPEDATLTGMVREKIIDSNMALMSSVIDNLAAALEEQGKRFVRITKLMAKLGATVTGTQDSLMYNGIKTAFVAADKAVALLCDRKGWVVRAVAGIGIAMYLWQACMGDATRDAWVRSYTSAIDWISGVFDRVLGSIPTVGGAIMSLFNYVFGNHIVVITMAYGKLQLQLSRLTSFCRLAAPVSDAQPSDEVGLPVTIDEPSPRPDGTREQALIDDSFAQAFLAN